VLKFPQTVSREHARGFVEDFDARHAGTGKRHRTTSVGGGADLQIMPVSMLDAQFIEQRGYSVEEIARIFNWPAWALDHTEENETSATTEQQTTNLLVFHLLSRLRRFEDALRADQDIFRGTTAYPEFVVDGFVRVDAQTRAEVEHKGVQSGTLLRDEVRADHGLPPLPDGAGQVVPATPVGATATTAPEAPAEEPSRNGAPT
jgi:HK97 family phage portal protein